MSSPPSSSTIAKGGAAYAAVAFAQKGIAFLLLPVYARVLGPEEFGKIALLTTVTVLLGTFFKFGLDSFVFRSYFQLADKPDERSTRLGSVACFLLIMPLLIVITLLLPTWLLLDRTVTLDPLGLMLGSLAVAFLAFTQSCALPLLRAQHELRSFMLVSSVTAGVTVGATLLFVLYFEWGAAGWFGAQLLGSSATIPIAIRATREVWRPTLDLQGIADALRFGIPLVPHQLAHWSLTLADRVILALFVTTAMVGIFSLGYQIVAVLGLVLTSINQTLMPEYARAVSNRESAHRLTNLVSTQVILTGFLGVSTALLVPGLISVFLPASFHDAIPLIPWLALGYVMYGLYFIPMNTLTLICGDTKWIWVFTVITGATNVGLNFVFIPSGGIMVPAVVTAVSYTLLFLLITLYSRWKHGEIVNYDYRRLLIGTAIITAGYSTAVLTSPVSSVGLLLARCAWCLLLAFTLMLAMGVPVSRLLPRGSVPSRVLSAGRHSQGDSI